MFDINDINVDLNKVLEEEKKANAQGFALYKIKNHNKTGFVQILSNNLEVIIKKKYLTSAELMLLLSLTPFIEFQTNAIVDEKGQIMSVSQIAASIKREKSGVSTTINKLIKKGIIFEVTNASEVKHFGRAISKRPLFINPELFYCGDRNRIDSDLSRMTIKFDRFEQQKILLPFKVWLNKNEEYGEFYSRQTYLKYKKIRF